MPGIPAFRSQNPNIFRKVPQTKQTRILLTFHDNSRDSPQKRLTFVGHILIYLFILTSDHPVIPGLNDGRTLDIVMTVACFWRAGQRFEGVPPRNGFEMYVDTHFDDRFMAETFENMRIGEDIPPASR